MANTSIEWTDKVWNPVTGCTKVSAGCKNCYAGSVANRFFAKEYPPNENGSLRVFTDVRCHEDRLEAPLHWRKPSRIFVNSMSDLFHKDVPDEFIDRVFAVTALCPQHTFQILTKRPERMREYMQSRSKSAEFWKKAAPFGWTLADFQGIKMIPFPLPNVWLGVSVEDQKAADERIPILLQTPAAVRFISAEPLLGPVSLRWKDSVPFGIEHPRHLHPKDDAARRVITDQYDGLRELDWVICGGESGPGARPCDIRWIRSVVEQCKASSVPCFVKQLGANAIDELGKMRGAMFSSRKGGDPNEWPSDLRVQEFPFTAGKERG